MKNRKSIFLVVLLLAVGFAAVSTTLYINGSTNINPNQDDFNVYYSNAYVNGTQDKSVIEDDTHIVFETELSALGEKYVLDYEVTNGSKNYDAELVMECTQGNDYLTVTNEFDDETILEARNTRNGTLTLELNKSNAGEDVDVTITCTINANAVERTTLNNSDIQTASDYIIEGYYMDENNNALANTNLVIFSDTPHYVTTDENGYLFYNGLERGNHEVYYVNDSLDNIKEMTKDEIIKNATSSAAFTTKTEDNIIFSNNTSITNLNIKESEVYCESLINKEWTFSYTGTEQKFLTRCEGDYKVELWGAQGGKGYLSNWSCVNGGKGAYTNGTIKVLENEGFYLLIGGFGQSVSSNTVKAGGAYNGGGMGSISLDKDDSSGGGGGATDIRLISSNEDTFKSLSSRIMVAAGGGGSHVSKTYDYDSGMHAGGLEVTGNISSWEHYWTPIVTQTSGGKFGSGTDGNPVHIIGAAGGGGGYYGGYATNQDNDSGRAAGGTCFISGHNGCDAISSDSTENNIIHTGQANHYSGYVFTDTIMIDGAGYNWTNTKGEYTGMPNHAGTSTMIGNTGNGYAKITYLGTN